LNITAASRNDMFHGSCEATHATKVVAAMMPASQRQPSPL
jgi:hypothetical protein